MTCRWQLDRGRLESDGFLLFEEVVASRELERIRAELLGICGGGDRRGGIRSILERVPALRCWADSGPPAVLARSLVDPSARPVKATLFDKTPRANWKVPWHQDLTIAVRERREVEGFGPWTIKDGCHHVQPTIEVLEGVVAIRVHFDDTPQENGALRVVPQSHRHGRLSREKAAELRSTRGEVVCPIAAGGAMAMRPLLLHASSISATPGRRRVLHIEYATGSLPGGLEWA